MQSLKSLNSVLAKVEDQQLTIDDLFFFLGQPYSDEILYQKSYNLNKDLDANFNCNPPFRYISYYRSALIIFELKLEDGLSFYFESDGKFCYFERGGL